MMKIRNYLTILIIILIYPSILCGQIGGNHTYSFLNLTNSARVASLGGKVIAIADNDLNLVFHNPALLNPEMDNHLVTNYVNYFADINYGYASYAAHSDKYGSLAAGIHYINYGTFIASDETGNITGDFKAAEYALNLFWSYPLDSFFRVGVNVKPIYSSLENYYSFGMALDLGLTYHNPEALFTASIVARNIGHQFKGYYTQHYEPLPFELIFGVSQRLRYAPFRFSFTAQQLQKFDLTYEVPENNTTLRSFSGEPDGPNRIEKFGDQLMRHIIVGVEFIPTENFFVRLGYNYQRRKEMQIISRVGGVGFSWGFGLKLSKFHLSYGRATYHLSGASNHFSVNTNLSDFYRRQ